MQKQKEKEEEKNRKATAVPNGSLSIRSNKRAMEVNAEEQLER